MSYFHESPFNLSSLISWQQVLISRGDDFVIFSHLHFVYCWNHVKKYASHTLQCLVRPDLTILEVSIIFALKFRT